MDLHKLLIMSQATIREAMACIDANARGIAVVVEDDRHLIGTVTDGDIRRAILNEIDVDAPIQKILDQQTEHRLLPPVSAPVGTSDARLLDLMVEYSIRHIPLIDTHGCVAHVAFLSDLIKDYELPLRAVIMAGGYGQRLRPLTDDTPKPMLPVGNRPLLERIIDNLKQAGIRHVNLATHYRADAISQHFRDGAEFGVHIEYVQEDCPLGTAGALSLLSGTHEPILVINGDILTQVDFRAMLSFHREHHADATVGVRHYEWRVPYGVVETDGVELRALVEKPLLKRFVNAGLYLLNPEMCRYVPAGTPYDMPDLLTQLLNDHRRVVCFPVTGYWRDIGQREDYEEAHRDVVAGRV